MDHKVVVVGSTGQIGSKLVKNLRARGVQCCAITRSTEAAAALSAVGAEPAIGELADSRFLSEAFAGAQAAFTMLPPDMSGDYPALQAQFIECQIAALRESSVEHIVNLSSVGADRESGTGPIAGLHNFEQELSSLADRSLTILRPAFFMENTLHSLGLIRGQGSMGGLLSPTLSLAMIATRDIADLASDLLSEPSFDGHHIAELQGPRNYTMTEVAAAISVALELPDLSYRLFSPDEAISGMVSHGMSRKSADLLLEMYDGFNTGHISHLEERAPSNTTSTSLEDFLLQTFVPALRGVDS